MGGGNGGSGGGSDAAACPNGIMAMNIRATHSKTKGLCRQDRAVRAIQLFSATFCCRRRVLRLKEKQATQAASRRRSASGSAQTRFMSQALEHETWVCGRGRAAGRRCTPRSVRMVPALLHAEAPALEVTTHADAHVCSVHETGGTPGTSACAWEPLAPLCALTGSSWFQVPGSAKRLTSRCECASLDAQSPAKCCRLLQQRAAG